MSEDAREMRGRVGSTRSLFALLIASVAVLLAGLMLWREARRERRSAYPPVEGVLQVAGSAEAVTILRDRRGVPHVRARSERDAWFGLGFAHAQDRLGQLVWLRRLALGRGAEIAGEDAATADALVRTLGFANLAARDFARASPAARAALEGYAAGVNAWLALLREGEAAPPLGLQEPLAEIDPWQPRDSLAIAKHHAFALADPIAEILVLEQVVRALGAGPARALFPVGLRVPAPSDAPRALAHAPSDRELAALTSLRRGIGFAGASVGSAGWVVAGEGTRRGRALLAADLHLPPTLPSRVYEAHLRGGALDVAGATLPGIPAFWLGFNADVAWALVATPAVVVDLFEETLYAEDATRYFEQGKWRALAQREERIAIAGGRERVVAVRETARGPLLDDLFPHAGRPLSVRWTGALGGGIDGLVALAHARDVAGAREALRAHEEPVADALLVDTRGGALQQLVGAAPRRAYPSGLQPVPSSNASYEWTARLSLEEMPARALGPGTRWLIAADAPLAPAAGAIETLWRPGMRAEQLEAQLRAAAARGPATLAEQLALQVDHGSLDARRSVAAISALMQSQRGLGSAERALLDLLRDWDGASAPESRAAAAFHVLAARTLKPLLAPALGEELATAYLALPRVPAPALLGDTLARAAAGGDPELPWTAPDLARATLAKALRETTLVLADRLGANAERWTWGRLHRVRFAPLWPGAWRGDDAALGPFELGGDGTTLAVSEYAALSESFDATVVSGYRLLVDAGNLDQALTAFAPGQSEHAGHPHATDAIERWQRGKASLLSTSDPVIEDGPVRELRLEAIP